jgi:hypothetical protein
MEKREDKTWAGGANPNAGPLGNQVGVLGLERCDTVIIYIYIYIYTPSLNRNLPNNLFLALEFSWWSESKIQLLSFFNHTIWIIARWPIWLLDKKKPKTCAEYCAASTVYIQTNLLFILIIKVLFRAIWSSIDLDLFK